MTLPVAISIAGQELAGSAMPWDLDASAGGVGPWEVEVGFGKGRFLLARAAAEPQRRFLGIEMVAEYYRLVARRAARRQLKNLMLVRGDALYLATALMPRSFAAAVHIYFPDPWPKTRHRRRRLFDPATVDLPLGWLLPGGTLYFATDYLEYGELVVAILEGFPGVAVTRLPAWPGGPRTHYESKYERDGRPILRLQATWLGGAAAGADHLHPLGKAGILRGWSGAQLPVQSSPETT